MRLCLLRRRQRQQPWLLVRLPQLLPLAVALLLQAHALQPLLHLLLQRQLLLPRHVHGACGCLLRGPCSNLPLGDKLPLGASARLPLQLRAWPSLS